MKRIALGNGGFTTVDDHDFTELNRYSWSRDTTGYAQRRGEMGDPVKTIRMHRQIMGHPRGTEVDHVDGDKLNNCRANLRLATRSQNMANGKRRSTNTSGYIGVHPCGKRWFARVRKDYAVIHLGVFDTPEEAARARDAGAIKHHGGYARLNFPA